MKVVRESKFRHVFGDVWKQRYEDLQLATQATESPGVRGNAKFVALPWLGGGGPLAIIPAANLGKVPRDLPKITGHAGQVLDFEFNPFDDNMLASASDDATIKVWAIPDGGLTAPMREAQATLLGHQKKVHFCTFNPCAEGILASSGADLTCKVWDLAKQEHALSVPVPEQMLSLRWSFNGSLLVGTCKDRKAHILDPRTSRLVAAVTAHEGIKSSKVEWLDRNTIVTTGFSRHTDRQVAMWDLRVLGGPSGDQAVPLQMLTLDQGSSALYPTFDEGTQLLYLAGKGDATVKFFELSPEGPFLHFLGQFSAVTTQKAFGFLPKRAVDVSRHELMRGLKLETNSLQPISFIVPRRSEEFKEDLFPDCPSATPALTASDWLAGSEVDGPVLQPMRPGATAEPSLSTASAQASAVQLMVGERVVVTKTRQQGIVRFLGETDFQAGHWVGLELDTDEGKHDGSVNGRRYFECPENRGIFLRPCALAKVAAAHDAGPAGAPPARLPGRQEVVPPSASSSADVEDMALLRAALARASSEAQQSAAKVQELCAERDAMQAALAEARSGEAQQSAAKVQELRAERDALQAALAEARSGEAVAVQALLERCSALEAELVEARVAHQVAEEALQGYEKIRTQAESASAKLTEAAPPGEAAEVVAARAPPPSTKPLTYKERKEQELRELEDQLSAEAGFAGKAQLSREEEHILEEKGTEAQGTGEYNAFVPHRGYFACRRCGKPIYSHEAKFKSGCGWPAFDKCYLGAIVAKLEDDGTDRVEITCAGCGGHLGHVFVEPGAHMKTRSDQRHCANSRALQYVKHDPPEPLKEVVVDIPPRGETPPAAPLAAAVVALAQRPVAVATQAATSVGPPLGPAVYAIDLRGLDRLVARLERVADHLS